MGLLKRFLTTMLVLIAVLVAVALVLPSAARVERSIEIDAPPERIYPLIIDFRQFNRWSPWFERDPGMKISFLGPASGRGAKMIWSSEMPEVGSGSQEIVAARQDAMVKSLLHFESRGSAFAKFDLHAQGGGRTRVTWSFNTDFGFDLVGRYYGLWLDRMVGADFEKGLESLKQLAEGG